MGKLSALKGPSSTFMTETDLDERFFSGRSDDLRPSVPARTIVARRV